MKKAVVFMADGFEEIEALTIVDILRRAEVQVKLCSIQDTMEVTGAHGVKLTADLMIGDLDSSVYDAAITPGGLPGASNLRDHEKVIEVFKDFYGKEGKLLGCICASPIVLEKAGIAAEIIGTCYPGFEGEVGFKEYKEAIVYMDKNVITSRGPATSIYFALKLVEELVGGAVAQGLKEGTMLSFVEACIK